MVHFPIKPLDQYANFAYFENAFSSEECDSIIELFDFKNATGARVGNDNQTNKSIRDSLINFISANDQRFQFILERVYQIAAGCNDARWKMQLSGFHEGLQFTHYRQGGFYNWHMDSGNADFSKRKLSAVIQLSDPDEYKGGDLEFIIDDRAPRSRGSLTLFPSYQVHRVTPVMAGSRFSLVAWISGEPLK